MEFQESPLEHHANANQENEHSNKNAKRSDDRISIDRFDLLVEERNTILRGFNCPLEARVGHPARPEQDHN